MPPPSSPADPLPRAISGDAEARAALVARHGGLIWSLCARLAADPEDAWQEIWEKALRALPRFDPAGPARFSTWLATLAHRHLVDRHRRRRTRGEAVSVEQLAALGADPEQATAEGERSARLEAALARLPEPWRRVIVAHHIAELPLDAIAEAEGVPVGTVKSRLHRGRAALITMLGGAL